MEVSISKFKDYYQLTKPGIIYGNLITATAGFLLASNDNIDFGLLFATLAGISLVIASACVFNNYIDRDIDLYMSRTKKRALVTGTIPLTNALIYATLLVTAGLIISVIYINMLVVLLGAIAFVDYVVFYGWSKRRTVHGTEIGSVAGAMPPVAGYVAVTNHLDTGAMILFLILVCWQMPHFYAIAIRRLSEYKAARIPVLPVKKGVHITKQAILAYIVAFTIVSSLLTVFDYTGYIYLFVVAGLGISWLWLGIKGFKSDDDKAWARKMFLYSLIVNLGLSLALSVGSILP